MATRNDCISVQGRHAFLDHAGLKDVKLILFGEEPVVLPGNGNKSYVESIAGRSIKDIPTSALTQFCKKFDFNNKNKKKSERCYDLYIYAMDRSFVDPELVEQRKVRV